MVIIVLTSAIGLASLHEFKNDENNIAITDDLYSKAKTVKIQISDGIGSKLSGFR